MKTRLTYCLHVLLTLNLTACKPKNEIESISFEFMLNDQPLRCGDNTATDLKINFQLHDLRLFAHSIQITGADGLKLPFELIEGGYQTSQVVLLDFEDGCHNGSNSMNKSFVGHSKATKPWKEVSFHVGVPPEFNHNSPLNAHGPLTIMDMHWSWQSGYKFMRLDGKLNGTPVRMHLGSAGCSQDTEQKVICLHNNIGELSAGLIQTQAHTQPQILNEEESAAHSHAKLRIDPLLWASNGQLVEDHQLHCMANDYDQCHALFSWLNIQWERR